MLKVNWDTIEGRWKQYMGEVKKQWGKLSDDELIEIAGKRDILLGKVQEKYGLAKDDANKQIDKWAEELKF